MAKKLLLPLLGGLLMALSPAPINAWFLAWIAIVPLWWSVLNHRLSFHAGLLWGAMYNGLALHWITGLHPLTWMGMSEFNSIAIVTIIYLLITIYGAACVGLWSWCLAWMTRRKLSPWIRVLSMAALWCGIEWIRSLTLLDWTSIAYTQSPSNLAILHLGQLSGNTLITAAIVAVNGTIAENLQPLTQGSNPRWKLKTILPAMLPAIGLFTISHLLGLSLSLTSEPDTSVSKPVEPIRMGSVQGNVPTRIKLSAPGIRQSYQHYGSGYETLARQGAQMVVFPEGALPLEWSDYPNNPIAQSVQSLKVPLAVGAWGTRGTRSTQALLMLNDRGEVSSQYDKVKVVPLGEALPFEEVLGKFIGRLSPVKSFLIPGQLVQIFTTPFGRAAIGICYESAFSDIFRYQVQQGAEFLITASNLDPYSTVLMAQHEAHDIMRAIETDRNLLRVTNTGYSGLIQSTGQRKWRSQPQSYDLHISEVFPRKTQTLYIRYGNWMLPLLVAVSLGAIALNTPP
jgi:apolipoprotein N-acyltransferase